MNRKEALLLELLESEDPSLREIYLANFSVDRPSTPLLARVVSLAHRDSHQRVRIAAVRTLARFWPEPSVVETFTYVLLSADPDEASAAVKAMIDLEDDRAIKLLCDTYRARNDFRTKGAVLQVLDRRPFASVREFMLTVPVRDYDEFLRAMAVTAISKKNDPSVVPTIKDRLSDPDARVRANATEGLARFHNLLPRELFVNLLKDPNHRVQTAALKILHRLGWEGIDEHVDRMTRSSIGLFRESAAYFLREIQNYASHSTSTTNSFERAIPSYSGASVQ